MGKIKINGTWFSKENEIKDGVAQASYNLLADSGDWRINVNGLSFDGLGAQDVAMLEDLFLKKEVFFALSDLSKDKVLGSNGFSMALWQFSWDFVKR